MFAPAENGCRILAYGLDSILLESRSLLLVSAGFRVETASSPSRLPQTVGSSQLPYELVVVCQTVPREELERIAVIAERSNVGLYRCTPMERPEHFLDSVGSMMSVS